MTGPTPSTNKPLFYLSLGTSILSALFLSVESYLQLHGSSLCQTSACEIVGNYLLISEQNLVAGGAAFFWILTVLFFFAQRYPKQLSNFPFLVLVVAMAFDGTLLGFQYFTIKQKCLLCMVTAAALLLTTGFYCLARKKTVISLLCLLAWVSGFSANGIMHMPEPTGAFSHMVFYQRNTEQTVDDQADTTNTLVFSMECPHCLEIIDRLAETNPQKDIWRLATIDKDNNSLMKISRFLDLVQQTDNPFLLISQIKQKSLEQHPIKRSLKTKAEKALTFLGNLNINRIPLLVVEDTKTQRTILIGSHAIHKHLAEKSFADKNSN